MNLHLLASMLMNQKPDPLANAVPPPPTGLPPVNSYSFLRPGGMLGENTVNQNAPPALNPPNQPYGQVPPVTAASFPRTAPYLPPQTAAAAQPAPTPMPLNPATMPSVASIDNGIKIAPPGTNFFSTNNVSNDVLGNAANGYVDANGLWRNLGLPGTSA